MSATKKKTAPTHEVQPVAPPKEELKETPNEEIIKVVTLIKCDKCNKSMTSKSLKYSHKCGEDKHIKTTGKYIH